MKLQNSSAVTLLEMTQIAPETIGGRNIVPMQFFRHPGKAANTDNKIFVLSGFQGPSKNDVHISGLLQKALTKGVLSPQADVFVTPVVNPSSDPKNGWMNHSGHDMRDIFADGKAQSPEAATLERWLAMAQPKAVITFTIGQTGVTTVGLPATVSQKLADLTERPLQALESPEVGTSPVSGLQTWCAAQGIFWIEISLDDSKKSFDEVRETDWKKSIGPCLKWLLEAERFNPPKEEPFSLEHLIVPALEMPPEFAHL
ncbi:MAG: hypothetical protein JST16_10365 [Bdellovibrionales bacterium]|nr:hypothetical protein [Bdellovibrionales bacterium]